MNTGSCSSGIFQDAIELSTRQSNTLRNCCWTEALSHTEMISATCSALKVGFLPRYSFLQDSEPIALVHADIDLSLQVGRVTNPSTIARRIAITRWLLFAAPQYLQATGIAKRLNCLQLKTSNLPVRSPPLYQTFSETAHPMGKPDTTKPGPPPLNWDELECKAQFDYVKVWADRKVFTPEFSGTHTWNRLKGGQPGYTLTVQDPVYEDLQQLVQHVANPMVAGVQLAVDIWPKPSLGAEKRESLLIETFMAVAGRFRPEDEAMWGYGTRGSVDAVGAQPKPFHRSFPKSHELLVYGRKHGWMQSTAYLKRTNEGADLLPHEHRVRMELTMTRGGLMELGIDRIGEFLNFPYQKTFNKHFRIISLPRARAVKGRSEAEVVKLERQIKRAWATAGVGKFAVAPELPPDTTLNAVRQIVARSRQQIPHADAVMVRDQPSNREIGNALRQLQRRMTTKKPGRS